MGSVIGHSDSKLLWAIEGLLDDGEIESGTYGVVQRVARQGYASLTAKEQAMYDRIIVATLERRSTLHAKRTTTTPEHL